MSLNRKRELIEIAKVERILWESIRNKKLLDKKFYRQYPIYYSITGKESFFVVDFYCHQKKLVVELDGAIHKYRLKGDKEREKILNYLGLKIIRFRNDEVLNNLVDVISKLKVTLKNLITP